MLTTTTTPLSFVPRLHSPAIQENKELKNRMATGTTSGPLRPEKALVDTKLLEKETEDLGRGEQREVVLVRPKVGEKSWGMMIGPLPGNRQGARISELVPGGLAQKAGALIDDVIISVNDIPVLDMPVGGVAGEVQRSGDTLRFKVAAASRNADFLVRAAGMLDRQHLRSTALMQKYRAGSGVCAPASHRLLLPRPPPCGTPYTSNSS